ncbi:MAG: hypothetical protein C4527_08620 [Candidatus Omnitrophota bacterium]|nr:MAG: hypothetical protein C4527_08620 [Candidatus Omnitrophota bacterium]
MNQLKYAILCMALALFFMPAVYANPSDIVWTDDVANNPVILEPGLSDANRAYYGCVIYDRYANIWRAWFDASSGMDIGYGESSDADGIEWGNYVLCKGFISAKQSKAFVIQLAANSFRMWYTAEDRGGGYIINSCVSVDGINWTADDWISGIAEPDPSQNGPTERFTAVRLEDGTFVAYVRCEEPLINQAPVGGKFLHRYTSADGVNWTWTGYTGANDGEGLESMEFSSVVKHPDKTGMWYAWGSLANSEHPCISYVSSDEGHTFVLDENPVANVGAYQTQTYNQNRNFHPSVTYLGNGNWVMFRSVADPKATARAVGVEEIRTPISQWELHD